MSGADHDSTDPDLPSLKKEVVAGEAVPPDEHTMRVRARKEKADQASEAVRGKAVATAHKVHDQTELEPVVRSSTELADGSRRARRRERDRKAESRAMQLVVLIFLGLGGGAFALFNLSLDDDDGDDPPATSNQIDPAPPPSGMISTKIDETPEIPALQSLRDIGLTIAAEGIPQVDAIEGSGNVAALAALETCRFAYAVWEFSPNKRFRFMTTCGALEGQVMFGAYEIEGAMIRMSPLITDTDSVVSEFHVERPSKMVSHVGRGRDEAPVLEIHQKVTAIRPGLDGDSWRDAFMDKNTIHLPGERPKAPPPSAPNPPPAKKSEKSDGDPLLELLKK